MRANYHTHTARCRHATGTEQEYIETAIASGMNILGFSDHAPYDYRGAQYRSGIRMPPEELPDYCAELRALQEQYAGRIELHIGIEAEYYPALFPRLVDALRANRVEYLILGQHWLGNETGEPNVGRKTDDKSILDRYVCQCIEGLQTGLFSCLAHPDLIHYEGDAAEYDRQMRRLCRAARELGVPLEINLHGLGEGRYYPVEQFWRIAAEEGNAVLLGIDAHRTDELRAPEVEAKGRELARRCGVTLAETMELRKL